MLPQRGLDNRAMNRTSPRAARLREGLAFAFLCLVPLGRGSEAHAKESWGRFALGAAAGFAIHEGSHTALDLAFDAGPRLKTVHFGPLPFFAITHRSDLPPGREAWISGAGFLSQHVGAEVILSSRGPTERLSSYEKGFVAFHVATSLAYAGAAFARYGPYERDTRGIASAVSSDERVVGALVLAPAVFDAWRAVRPQSRTARWGSRLSKAAFLGFIALKR